ncbi:hypothetical protein CLOM_g13543 [Closterium sp. NIES-68]|nr:hypothetical protein CLOM_g13543 [Closterium sp. NIES-68]
MAGARSLRASVAEGASFAFESTQKRTQNRNVRASGTARAEETAVGASSALGLTFPRTPPPRIRSPVGPSAVGAGSKVLLAASVLLALLLLPAVAAPAPPGGGFPPPPPRPGVGTLLASSSCSVKKRRICPWFCNRDGNNGDKRPCLLKKACPQGQICIPFVRSCKGYLCIPGSRKKRASPPPPQLPVASPPPSNPPPKPPPASPPPPAGR